MEKKLETAILYRDILGGIPRYVLGHMCVYVYAHTIQQLRHEASDLSAAVDYSDWMEP